MALRSLTGSAAAAALLSALSIGGVASATIMLPLTIEDMAQEAALVVRAKVLHREGRMGPDGRKIYTHTRLQVVERIHAEGAIGEEIEVRSLGGEVGELGMKVSGTEHFTVGEDVLVFLRVDPIVTGSYQVVGMSQGKFQVQREAKGRLVALAALEGLAFARPGSDGVLRVDESAPRADKIPLDELRTRVRAARVANPSPARPARSARTTPPVSPASTARPASSAAPASSVP